MDTNTELRSIIDKHSLTRKAIATITDSSIYTVDSWLAPADNNKYRVMPRSKLRLLKLTLNIPN